uniref:Uncharacterized protein n=1 Tax=Timema douglasi TaxID=61478 RepID=A0A7R8VRD7_TIMDO|nr:unnamed protein product [Timema douglasi]
MVFLCVDLAAFLSLRLAREAFLKSMSDFPVESVENGDMAAVMENFQKKNSLGSRQQVASSAAQQQQQQLLANTSTTSSSSSRVAKTSCSSSQRVHHVTSSEMKASSMKSDLSELKSSISEMKNLSSAATAMNFSSRLRSSMEELDREDTGGGGDASDAQDISEPLVTFPDPDTPPPVTGAVSLVSPNLVTSMGTNGVAVSSAASIATASSSSSSSSETVKYEQKRVTSASKTKVVTDGFSSEQATANSSEMKMVQAGEMSYQEQSAAAAMRARLEVDGVSAEKSVAMKQKSAVSCQSAPKKPRGYCTPPRRVTRLKRVCFCCTLLPPRSSYIRGQIVRSYGPRGAVETRANLNPPVYCESSASDDVATEAGQRGVKALDVSKTGVGGRKEEIGEKGRFRRRRAS